MKYKRIIIGIILAAAALICVFFLGDTPKTQIPQNNKILSETSKMEEEAPKESDSMADEPVAKPDEEAVPNENPAPQEDSSPDKEPHCTLSVSCGMILNNMEKLDVDKAYIIPKDGIIFPEQAVAFSEGESALDLLQREMRNSKMHFEFSGGYIEGIANIYEFDCGELSGWIYRVNGVVPNYGCAEYTIKQGDKIEFLYSCDLGKDVGDNYNERI